MTGIRVVTTTDAVKVEYSGQSASVSLQGNIAGRLGNQIADALSPFTNALGFLGDRLAISRQEAALRAISRASARLRAEGISSGQIPPKILLPWLDGASLETEGDSSLTEAWVGIFVRAVKSSDALVISYIETLKRLGEPEAKLLAFFTSDITPTYSSKFYEVGAFDVFSTLNPSGALLVAKVEDVLTNHGLEKLEEFFETVGLQNMCQVMFYRTIETSNGNTRYFVDMRDTKYFRKNEHVISNLENLGLIRISYAVLDRANGGKIEIVYFRITKFAFDLFWACKGTLTGNNVVQNNVDK